MLAGVFLVLVAFVAYLNSFSGPFIYDDISAIPDNPTIRHLWPPWDVLMPPHDSGVTVNGRPIVNLSLAINYALGGTGVYGYHVTNLLIHILAGLTLFGLARRTLLQPGLHERFGSIALSAAWLIAALWTAHPLQTESVTYVIQRAEALVGFFYVLTLYCFIRSVDSADPLPWRIATVASCLLGMACKEVMVSAPLIVLLYDRTFVSGTFARAWQRNAGLYLGLAATWVLLAFLVVNSGGRGGTAGFGAGGIAWWSYAFTQCRAIMRYLWLAVWPRNLVFDYGDAVDKEFVSIAPEALVLLGLATGTAIALWRRPAWGFLGICFFAILAPSSSIVPIATETMAEHRMYLPLAAVMTGAVLVCVALLGPRTRLIFFAATAGAIALTLQRNEAYRDDYSLWADTLRKWPSNPRAHNNVGEIFFRHKRIDEAIAEFREAVRLLPNYVDALNNLGNVLAQAGRPREGMPFLELALRLKPKYAEVHTNLGNALYELGFEADAVAHFEEALKIKPTYADPHNNLGVILGKHGRVDDALQHYQEALKLKPDYADAHYNYGNALAQVNRLDEAIAHYRQALQIKPDYPEVLNNLGRVLILQGHNPEALAHFEQALKLRPDFADAHSNYAVALFKAGRLDESIAHLKRALEINPDFTDARNNLAYIQSVQQAKAVKP